MTDRPTITYIEEPGVPRPTIAYIGEEVLSPETSEAPDADEPPAVKRGKKTQGPIPTNELES